MKTILITGASQGIGAATAEAFWDAGWHVGLLARSADKLEALAEGRPATILPADVSDEASVDAAFAAFAEEAGRLDVLFNNAGMFGPQAPIDQIDYAAWREVVDVNLNGMFLCARAAFRQMRAQSPQGGRIINNGSISATTPRPRSAPYTSTKHAITGLTKSISLDGREFDITCGQIDIGNAATPMTRAMERGVPQANGETRAEPTMDVAHVAQAVLQMDSLPLDTNVLFMTIMANEMPFVGRG